MKRLHSAPLAAILMLAAVAALATTPLVSRLLPKADQAKGLKVMRGSLIYGKDSGLADIYDGGYELYTDHGVIDAAQQLYTRDKDVYEVTVHSLKSPREALEFLKYWQKENKINKAEKTDASVGFTRITATPAAFYSTKKYLTIVNVSTSKVNPTTKERAHMASLAKALAMAVENNIKHLAN